MRNGVVTLLLVQGLCACGGGGGGGGGGAPRTVSGTFQTTFWTDDGTKTTVNAVPQFVLDGPAGTPSALLVPDSSTSGYTKFPFSLDANQSFSVPGVPAGPYFIELDRTETFPATCGLGTGIVEVTVPQFFQSSLNTPDLGAVTAARPDLRSPLGSFPKVTLNVTGMDAWGSADDFRIASSQARVNQLTFFVSPPTVGATEFSGTTDWISALPDASKKDVVFVYQRARGTVSAGANAASVRRATKVARLTDLTVADGTTTTATVPLVAVPQTGAVRVNLAAAQFAALAADVNPEAVLTGFGVGVAAIPHSISYPDMPPGEGAGLLSVNPANPVDADYGTVSYGQFLDPFWQERASVVFAFDVASVETGAIFFSDIPVSALPAGPLAPVVSPPKSPRVNGSNAFVKQVGVGLQPTISWSPPSIGAPTSYIVEIRATALPCASGQTAGVSAVIHDGTSFRVPPGILTTGIGYRAVITAQQAPWDTTDAGPFRMGTPLHSAQCVTAQFVP